VEILSELVVTQLKSPPKIVSPEFLEAIACEILQWRCARSAAKVVH